MYNFFTRFLWTAVSNDVAVEFALNQAEIGAYMSAFFAGYLITQIPGGILADKYQPKIILIICTLLGGISTSELSFIQNYSSGVILRVISGISAGAVMACCTKIISANFEPQKRSVAIGILFASPPVGILLANFLGRIMNTSFGWRNSFLFTGFFAVLYLHF